MGSMYDLEATLLSRRIKYVRDLKSDDILDLQLMECCRDDMFVSHGIWTARLSARVKFNDSGKERIWNQGRILRRGPPFVARMWDNDFAVRKGAELVLEKASVVKSRETLLLEEKTQTKLRAELEKLSPGAFNKSCETFTAYGRHQSKSEPVMLPSLSEMCSTDYGTGIKKYTLGGVSWSPLPTG